MAIKISELNPRAPEGLSKDNTKKAMNNMAKEIAEQLTMMYANNNHSLLVVLQGMDSSGKDGVCKNVFRYTSPTMISAYSFKKPTDLEFAHDFLWRVHQQSPRKGQTKIFVRSHYEDILIQRVHGWIDEERVNTRIEAINAYEKLLEKDNNTIIMKFFLHLSKDRQKEKLIERIEIPRKFYKHNDGDWDERQHWDKYMAAYEDAINRSDIPWHIVPSDQRWYRNYFVAKTVLERLKSLNLSYPPHKEEPQVDIENG